MLSDDILVLNTMTYIHHGEFKSGFDNATPHRELSRNCTVLMQCDYSRTPGIGEHLAEKSGRYEL